MKKETVTTTIAVHPFQAALIKGLQAGKIDLEIDSLRDIVKKCTGKKGHAQIAQHHISYLVKLGVIQIIRGQHIYFKEK